MNAFLPFLQPAAQTLWSGLHSLMRSGNWHMISNLISVIKWLAGFYFCIATISCAGGYSPPPCERMLTGYYCINHESSNLNIPNRNCVQDLMYLKASRPAKCPVSVLGLGWFRKSFSINRANDFCTSLQYGEWKTKNPKSSRLKCFSEPSVRKNIHKSILL